MDEFYRSIYNDLFLNWLLSNTEKFKKDGINCFISRDDELGTTFTFEGSKYKGTVSIWESEIVEQVIYDTKNDKLMFYLHFTILQIKQFHNLFDEFYNELLKLENAEDIKIAFCCTGGLSTSLFVTELLQVCKLQKIDYQLYSVSLPELDNRINEFDAIYLAPQISHLQPELIQKTKQSIPIHRIDPTIFATKNYQQVLKTIKENLNKDKQSYSH